MIEDRYQFASDIMAKFFRSIVVSGWFMHHSDYLTSVEIIGPEIICQTSEIGATHSSVKREDGRGCGFWVECLRASTEFPHDLGIRFSTHFGRVLEARLIDLAAERSARDASQALYAAFHAEILSKERPTVVDLGGRDRSGFDRAVDFPGCNYRVVDILPSGNVEIVGDAHALSSLIPEGSADAIISAFAFEHFLMPWKVAVEMNRVLKLGGTVCVLTHQTLGWHDFPWDFWRFSNDAWSALFNSETGFEIIETAMSSPQFIIPFFYQDRNEIAERGAGYEFSAVWARKIGPSKVDWPVALDSIITTIYPTDDLESSVATDIARNEKI